MLELPFVVAAPGAAANLALTPWASATAAIDTPGRSQPIPLVDTIVNARQPRNQDDFPGRSPYDRAELGFSSGARVWVVTDDDPVKALALAEQLGREIWAMRDATRMPMFDVDGALDAALAVEGGPVVLADAADNAGGGAPSDCTFILRRLVDRNIGDSVVGMFWDPGAIQICAEAGEGATLDLPVGGKCGPTSGMPVDVRGTVRAIVAEHSQDVFSARWPLGRSVWVEAEGGLHLVLCSIRTQVYGTDAFTGLGLTLTDKALIVVKSAQHFHTAFAPLAKAVLYVDSSGAISSDFERIPYAVRSLDHWPRVADPHGWERAAAPVRSSEGSPP